MSHSFLDDNRFLISGRTDDYRAFLISRGPGDMTQRSFETNLKRLAVHMRRIFVKPATAASEFLHRWAVAIGESKLRRVHRELALHGIHYNHEDPSKSVSTK
jgi:hypothetical protein